MNTYCFEADLWCEDCALDIKLKLVREAIVKAGFEPRDLIQVGVTYRFTGSALSPVAYGTIQVHLPCSGWEIERDEIFWTGTNPARWVWLTPPINESLWDSGEWPKGPYGDGGGAAGGPHNCAGGGDCLQAFETYPGVKVGVFLENPLTKEGYRYLQEMLDERGKDQPVAASEWARYYSFTWHGFEFDNAHEWLLTQLGELSHANLLSYARSLANAANDDSIERIFAAELSEQGFFGADSDNGDNGRWTSDEMSEE